jgi:methyl-accepting chemotaxis protein
VEEGSNANQNNGSSVLANSRLRNRAGKEQETVSQAWLQRLFESLAAAERGNYSVRLPNPKKSGLARKISAKFNQVVARNEALADEIARVEQAVRQEGRMTDRAALASAADGWSTLINSINSLIEGLVQPTEEVARVISAVAAGDLSQKMALEIEREPVKGEFLRIGKTVNSMVDQLSSFAAEVTRVAKEVGTEGKLGGKLTSATFREPGGC